MDGHSSAGTEDGQRRRSPAGGCAGMALPYRRRELPMACPSRSGPGGDLRGEAHLGGPAAEAAPRGGVGRPRAAAARRHERGHRKRGGGHSLRPDPPGQLSERVALAARPGRRPVRRLGHRRCGRLIYRRAARPRIRPNVCLCRRRNPFRDRAGRRGSSPLHRRPVVPPAGTRVQPRPGAARLARRNSGPVCLRP
jgi:hypothetical protein